MCGIFGYATSKLSIARDVQFEAVLNALTHRGPDDSGRAEIYTDTVACGFAHTRLSILDLTTAGHQPMRSDDERLLITYNGEIYNFRDLRSELEAAGHRFRTQCDTEVILKAYEEWGPACVHRFRGMFAFAIFDRRDRSLFLARDRLGIKPLYYSAIDGGIAFASEIRALVKSGLVTPRLSAAALRSYFRFGSVWSGQTVLAEVRSMTPGTTITFRDNVLTEQTYWSLPNAVADPRDVREATEEVRLRLRESVRLRLIADVSVGIFLSGGIDSSAILAVASEIAPHTLKTFSVGFDEKTHDESRYAEIVASRFGSTHHQVNLPGHEVSTEFESVIAALDQPSVDGCNTYFVSKAAHEAGLKVALSGVGGDEVFAGYSTFKFLRAVQFVLTLARRLPTRALPRSSRATSRFRKVWPLLQTGGELDGIYTVLRSLFLDGERDELLTDDVSAKDPVVLSSVGHAVDGDPINSYSRLELTNYLRGTLLRDTDVMSMRHSLEVRLPFLDHRLVEAVLSIPGGQKLARGTYKPLLLAAVPRLPDESIQRRKMGFSLPFDAWMKGPLRARIEDLVRGDTLTTLGICRRTELNNLWRRFFVDRLPGHEWRIWSLAALAGWCQNNRVFL